MWGVVATLAAANLALWIRWSAGRSRRARIEVREVVGAYWQQAKPDIGLPLPCPNGPCVTEQTHEGADPYIGW
jgi:hypothetical protein